MGPDLTDFISRPWGLAAFLFVLLAPRIVLRQRDPRGMQTFGARRLLAGYIGAVALALLTVFIADSLGLRAWTEATPIRSAVELMAVSPVSKYILGGLLAWGAAAFLVAPIAAWLATFSLANGLLVIATCIPVGVALGLGCWFAWLDEQRSLSFNLACSLVLVISTALGFSVGTRLHLSIRRGGASAA